MGYVLVWQGRIFFTVAILTVKDVTMKPSSAKAKGRSLAKAVATSLLDMLVDVTERDVRVTPSGVNGPDVQLSEAAFKQFPFKIECKNQESLNIWAAHKQVEAEEGDGTPIVIFKRNRSEIYCSLHYEDFLKIATCAVNPYLAYAPDGSISPSSPLDVDPSCDSSEPLSE